MASDYGVEDKTSTDTNCSALWIWVLIIDNNGHLHFQVNGSKIFIKALYIYVCMPIFIYIFKERQFYTVVIQCKEATVSSQEERLQSQWNHVS